MKQFYFHPKKKAMVAAPTTRPALRQAWTWVVDDVLKKRSEGDTGKFIVNMSLGAHHEYPHDVNFANMFPAFPVSKALDERDWTMASRLEECRFHDIITVVPAGNRGNKGGSLDKLTPQKLGSPFNALNTVGGVNNSGVL
jgi:hypothetical protein